MKRRLLFSLSALAGAGLATLVSQTGILPGAIAASSETYRQLNIFGDVYDKVRTGYVEQPTEAKLIEGAINGMLTSLDPHSSYLSPNEFKEMQTQTRGEFGGLGIEVTMEGGGIKGGAPIAEPPAPSWHSGQRHHHPDQRRARAGPDPQSGRGQDARPRELAGEAPDPAEGQEGAAWGRADP